MGHKVDVVIVGSRQLRVVPARILGLLANLPGTTTIRLRHPQHGEAELFERIVAAVAKNFGLSVMWCIPEGGGRESTYLRDVSMVRGASLVMAFFAEDEMSGGTEHVVDKALDQQVPVYSYGLRDGKWFLIGSHDINGAWMTFSFC